MGVRTIAFGTASALREWAWRRMVRSLPLPGFLGVKVCSLASQGTSETHPILSLAVFHGGRRTFLEKKPFIGEDLLGRGWSDHTSEAKHDHSQINFY